jgi:hypothetical protein
MRIKSPQNSRDVASIVLGDRLHVLVTPAFTAGQEAHLSDRFDPRRVVGVVVVPSRRVDASAVRAGELNELVSQAAKIGSMVRRPCV